MVTGITEMIAIINSTQNWYPRERELSEFTFLHGNPYSVVGFKNVVVFRLPSGKIVEEKYRENWIFKIYPTNIRKPIRIHYSSITEETHSEEVG